MPSVLAARSRAAATLRRTCERASASLAIGVGAAAALATVARPGLFTTCSVVASNMVGTAPLLAASVASFTMMAGLEGMMIARKQLRQLAVTHTALSLVLIVALRGVTRTAGCKLQHVWALIALLNAGRWVLFRQTVRRSEAAEAAEEAAGLEALVPNISETHPHLCSG